MKEQAIQSKIIKWLRSQGHFVVNCTVVSPQGTPDILACMGGRFVGIEVKTATGKMSDVQFYQSEQIKKAGGLFILARSLDDVKNALINHKPS